jgi:hypothetical protein
MSLYISNTILNQKFIFKTSFPSGELSALQRFQQTLQNKAYNLYFTGFRLNFHAAFEQSFSSVPGFMAAGSTIQLPIRNAPELHKTIIKNDRLI